MALHVHRAPMQEATSHRIAGIDHLFTYSPGTLMRARCCKKKRRAANLLVQVYYDESYWWCKPGKGCKP